jgi:3-carboxy-cis,cis-muconate cycloisomerase
VNASDVDLHAISVAGRTGGNPVIPLVKSLGTIADKVHVGASDHLHLGATSQDILDSAAMVIAAQTIAATTAHLDSVMTTLSTLARLHRATSMAGRTLGQHASPITFGLVVAGWLDGIEAAGSNLQRIGSRLPAQYGGAVGSRAILREIVRERRPEADADHVVNAVVRHFANGLGLRDAAPWQSNRIPIVELGSALAAVVGAIGAMAADINMLSRTEISEVSERLAAGEGGSSAMPHKRNPVTSVLLVSAARRSPGLVATLFDAQVTEDQRSTGAWHSEWQTLRELERIAIQTSATAADLAARLEVDVARMRSNLDVTDGLIYSERVTAILAESLGKSAAFRLVEQASRESVQTSRPFQVVIAGLLAADHDVAVRSRVLAAFDPDYGLEAPGVIIDEVLARTKERS